MNSLTLSFFALILLAAGYRFYGRFMEKFWGTDPDRKTPAHTEYDGIDYIPAKHWTVLFGHHFASIAGAGPIIGPVIACLYWGWMGVVGWLIVGSIFMGAVHDFTALMASVRNGGKSIAHVCGDTLGRRVSIIFSVFLWLSLILVVAVFAAVGGKTLEAKPEIVIPALGIIPTAVITGILLYRTRLGQTVSTVVGLVLLTALIFLGRRYPVGLPAAVGDPAAFWTVLLLLYAFAASVIPVNVLLQPRDYLSTFILFFGLVSGYLGIIISRPDINAPAFTGFNTPGGPMWPMMFVIIACGAISGFHSVVSSGTTVKQMSTEKDARPIGFGAMILESALAVLALVAVSAGLYWSPQQGFPVYAEVMKKGWIVAFSEGFGRLTSPIFGNMGILIAATMLNAFIITTLDTATRVTRYITEELFSIRNKYLSTSIIIACALYFALGNWRKIWPVFGASNQLVAALALLVVSAYLMAKGKRRRYTLIPAGVMLATSGGALLWQLNSFWQQRNYLLSGISGLLLIMAVYITWRAVIYFRSGGVKISG